MNLRSTLTGAVATFMLIATVLSQYFLWDTTFGQHDGVSLFVKIPVNILLGILYLVIFIFTTKLVWEATS